LAEGRRFEVVMLSQNGVQYSDSRIYFVRLHCHSSRAIVGSLRYVVSSRDCLRTVSAVLGVGVVLKDRRGCKMIHIGRLYRG
jgi:hypothetical protein